MDRNHTNVFNRENMPMILNVRISNQIAKSVKYFTVIFGLFCFDFQWF